MKAVAFAAVTSLVLLFVWERVDIVRIGYHIERLKVQKVALERERDELQVKLSALTAPERIARLAGDKLGMMQPEKGQVVVVHIEPEAPVSPMVAEGEVRIAKNFVSRRGR
jgi:cell division protein FtsL